MLKMKKILTILFIFICCFSFIFIGKVFAATNIIRLTNISVVEETSGADGQITDHSSTSVDTNNTYHSANNYVEYLLTIKNVDSKPYSIKNIYNDNQNPNITYSYYDYKDKILKPNQEVQIKIRETYSHEINDISERAFSNSVNFYFNLVDEDGVEIYDGGINPVTGDNIVLYVGVGAISLTLLFVILLIINIRLKNKNKKLKSTLNKLPLILLLLLASVPIAVKANAEVDAIITFNNNTALYDKVKVTLKYNGVQKEKIIKYNSLLTEPKDPKKKGYTFDGWYVGENKYDFTSRVTSDIVLNAKFTKNTYTITYNLNGGSANNPSTYNVSNLPVTLENPTKTGYNFKGWTGSNGTTPQKDLVIENTSGDKNYTAVYEAIQYDITYKGLKATEITSLNNPKKYTIEDTVTLTNPTNRVDKDGDPTQRFVGWKDDNGDVSKTISFNNSMNNKKFEAVWIDVDPTVYTITYELHNGHVDGTNPVSFTKTTETFTLINPTKTGYNFTGWTGSNGNVPELTVTVEEGTMEDLTFEANYAPIDYSITYNLDGGSATNPATYTIETNTITLNNPTKRGYTFIGWTGTDLQSPTLSVTIPVGSTGAREYTANYTLDTYNITYHLYDGVAPGNPATYTVNDTFTLVNPVKTGAVFTGWTGSNGDVPQTTVTVTDSTGALEYTANYTAASYSIHFDKNDSAATGTMADEVMTVGTAQKLTKNAFVKEGYAFDKWTTNPDGTGTVYDDEELVTDLALTGTVNLYARWKKLKIATFDTGKNVNIKMKTIAGQSSPRESTANSNIKKVLYNSAVPQEYMDDAHKVSAASSTYDIYMWFDSNTGTMYYGSDEADVLYLGSNAAFFYACLQNVKEIENNYITSNVTNMEQMFYRCRELETNRGLSDFDTHNVKSMKNMFGENYKMTSYDIKSWDVDNVQIFEFMFNQNTALTSLDLRGWTTKSATNMKNMFSSMYILTDLKIDDFDTSNVTMMNNMFDNERAMVSLDLRHFNTSNVTTMMKMFYNMYALQSLDISSFDTRNVTTMEKMFIGTNTIQTLDLSSFDTSKVKTFSNMFDDMTALQTIYVSNSFVTTAATSTPQMFLNDTNLEGGAGTVFDSNQIKLNYAHIDGGPSNPGYFTRKQ